MTNNMWELECIQSINDGNVIFAAFSTAQFTPKLLFDKNPYIIFLYKIFDLEVKGADEMIERFAHTYKYKSKIFVPKCMEEIDDIIKITNEM